MEWNFDMNAAPKDRHVVVWVDHKSDPYFDSDKRLTTYGAHCESFGRCQDGLQIVVWGGEWDDSDDGYVPAWWFVRDTDFESVANPVAWIDAQDPRT